MAGRLFVPGDPLIRASASSISYRFRLLGTAQLNRQLVCFQTKHSHHRRNAISHVVQIQTQVRDAAAIQAACRRLNLAEPIHGSHKLFNSTATGLGVRLPGWSYPVVCDLSSGQLQYDNFNGRWGEPAKLDQFLQAYAVEMAKIQARKKGHMVTEQALASGEIKLTIHVGGAA